MSYTGLFSNLFVWWYSRGFTDLFSFLKNLVTYLYNFFSISTIFQTLFSPWKKMTQERRPGIDGLKDWLADNLVSRGVGFVMRLILIGSFVVSLFVLAVFSFLALAFWFLMPVVIVGSFLWIFA